MQHPQKTSWNPDSQSRQLWSVYQISSGFGLKFFTELKELSKTGMTFSGKPLPLPCPPCPARLTWKQVFPETFGTSQNDSQRLAWLALRHCFTTTHHKTSQHKTSQRKIPRLTICSLGSRSKLPTPFDARCSCGTRSPHIFASLKHLYLFTTSISATLCHQQSVKVKASKASPECLRSQAHTRPPIDVCTSTRWHHVVRKRCNWMLSREKDGMLFKHQTLSNLINRSNIEFILQSLTGSSQLFTPASFSPWSGNPRKK